MALPLAMVIVAAEIDLSVASVLAVSSALMAYLWNHGQPVETIIPICLVAGGAVRGLQRPARHALRAARRSP